MAAREDDGITQFDDATDKTIRDALRFGFAAGMAHRPDQQGSKTMSSSLDMTGMGRYEPGRHWRRYLTDDGTVQVIPVDPDDYGRIDSSRFPDIGIYESKAEALASSPNLLPLIIAADTPETAAQALVLIRATLSR